MLTARWLFWMAGAAALTASLGGGADCNLNIAYCGQLNASEAFAWIEWILMTFTLVVVLILGSSAIRRGDRLSSGLTA